MAVSYTHLDVYKRQIKRDETGNYCVRINSKQLSFTKDIPEETFGIPEKFYIRGDKINFSPTPKEKCIITIEYITLAIGENIKGEEIYSLKEDTDSLIVPPHLEELVKNAITVSYTHLLREIFISSYLSYKLRLYFYIALRMI